MRGEDTNNPTVWRVSNTYRDAKTFIEDTLLQHVVFGIKGKPFPAWDNFASALNVYDTETEARAVARLLGTDFNVFPITKNDVARITLEVEDNYR